ncbi:hypothetical protein B0T26DRAFT_640073 [Lasiosphaeria miniovina]|uniref:CFEM domain-containing protein n=1 Tax=Lasiosphaeria miniovina TaxID=1954250 RepID=A0AA40E547_9PEZI|nr:uncharacterized protein B0T26DRAFT_640073 [Lasiosphaeria miniovina]KAK0727475.1 hypothetical protein B0T26DRAFT_640073 [Lasiosphaeria miniovina]
MKYSAVLVTALAALVSAQDLSAFPACSTDCIADGAKAAGCSNTDFKCICEAKDKFVSGATSCVVAGCGIDVALAKVLPAVDALCVAVLAGGSDDTATTSSTAATTTTEDSSSSTEAPSTSSTEDAVVLSTSTTAQVTSSAAPHSNTTTTSAGPFTLQPTTTKSSTTTSFTAGAAVASSIGSLGMLVLGALAAL